MERSTSGEIFLPRITSGGKKDLAKQMRQDQLKTKRKMSKFEAAVSKVKPALDPKDKTFQEYLNRHLR